MSTTAAAETERLLFLREVTERAQRLMAGQPGFTQDIIDSREDRV